MKGSALCETDAFCCVQRNTEEALLSLCHYVIRALIVYYIVLLPVHYLCHYPLQLPCISLSKELTNVNLS